jgi:predicted benzoate:H+ symporter BenE
VDGHDAEVLADLEQQLFPEAVRRFRRRWWAATAGLAAGTAAGAVLGGLLVLPVLLAVLLAGGLVVVSRVTEAPAPAGRRPGRGHLRRVRHPAACSTKS